MFHCRSSLSRCSLGETTATKRGFFLEKYFPKVINRTPVILSVFLLLGKMSLLFLTVISYFVFLSSCYTTSDRFLPSFFLKIIHFSIHLIVMKTSDVFANNFAPNSFIFHIFPCILVIDILLLNKSKRSSERFFSSIRRENV